MEENRLQSCCLTKGGLRSCDGEGVRMKPEQDALLCSSFNLPFVFWVPYYPGLILTILLQAPFLSVSD